MADYEVTIDETQVYRYLVAAASHDEAQRVAESQHESAELSERAESEHITETVDVMELTADEASSRARRASLEAFEASGELDITDADPNDGERTAFEKWNVPASVPRGARDEAAS